MDNESLFFHIWVWQSIFLHLVDTSEQLLPNPQNVIRFEFFIVIEEYKYGNSNTYFIL